MLRYFTNILYYCIDVTKLTLSVCQWRSYSSCRLHFRGGAYLGGGVQGAQQAVPRPCLQGVPEEPAPADQILQLQRGQHPTAGGRLTLPQR